MKNNFDMLPNISIPDELKNKFSALIAQISQAQSAIIAFSGGVDSSLLAYLASRILPVDHLAITFSSELDVPFQVERAKDFAKSHGIRHAIVKMNPLGNPLIVGNAPERCYYCKIEMMRKLHEIADEKGYASVMEGQNADDLSDFRPGRKAVLETQTLSPFVKAGMTKSEIRALSKAFSLETWNLPSSPCMATRIPYHTPLTQENLSLPAKGEQFLHSLGIQICRVRNYARTAIIEVPENDMDSVYTRREEIVCAFSNIGFIHCAFNLAPFRSGNLNRDIASNEN